MSQATTTQTPVAQTINHTQLDVEDEVHTPDNRVYEVASTYTNREGAPFVHLRRKYGRHDMYLPVSRLNVIVRTKQWSYHPREGC